MLDPNADAPVFNQLPPIVVMLAVLIGAPEVIFQLGEAGLIGGASAINWRISIATSFGFYNAPIQWMWETGTYPWEYLVRFVSYLFVHREPTSVLFSVVFVLALGKFVGERVSSVTLLVFFLGSGIFAAFVHAILLGPQALLLGAGPAAYGLIGAFSWIVFTDQRAAGESGLRAFGLIGGLALIHLIFFLIFGGDDWFGRAFGAVAGILLCIALRPFEGVGFGYWMDRLRQRGAE